MSVEITNEELSAIEKAVISKKSIMLPDNKYCVLQSIDTINKTITCLVTGDNTEMVIPFSDIIQKQYKLSEGGSKSRKRLIRKRKGKKSYRKKKYGKTKKSRRFRRSVRSRR
jgi:hypothetical protein